MDLIKRDIAFGTIRRQPSRGLGRKTQQGLDGPWSVRGP